MKGKYDLATVEAAIYAAAPLVLGACGNWIAGWLADTIYRQKLWTLSRRVPAIVLAVDPTVNGALLGTALVVVAEFAEATILGTTSWRRFRPAR